MSSDDTGGRLQNLVDGMPSELPSRPGHFPRRIPEDPVLPSGWRPIRDAFAERDPRDTGAGKNPRAEAFHAVEEVRNTRAPIRLLGCTADTCTCPTTTGASALSGDLIIRRKLQ